MKSNEDDAFVSYLIEKGHKFDCASMNEIKSTLKLGARPEDIIYANPVKDETHLEYAKEVGVKVMTMDSEEECEKIKEIYPEAELVLRIAV